MDSSPDIFINRLTDVPLWPRFLHEPDQLAYHTSFAGQHYLVWLGPNESMIMRWNGETVDDAYWPLTLGEIVYDQLIELPHDLVPTALANLPTLVMEHTL